MRRTDRQADGERKEGGGEGEAQLRKGEGGRLVVMFVVG